MSGTRSASARARTARRSLCSLADRKAWCASRLITTGPRPAYFTDDEVAARTEEQLDLLAMLRDRELSLQEVNHLAAMAKTPQALWAVVEKTDNAVEVTEI